MRKLLPFLLGLLMLMVSTITNAAIPVYNITIKSNGEHGQVVYKSEVIRNESKDFIVQEGSNITGEIIPDEGYVVSELSIKKDGFINSKGEYADKTSRTHTFDESNIKNDIHIEVKFEAIDPNADDYCTITINSHTENGYSVYNGDEILNGTSTYKVKKGESATITSYPNEGYRISQMSYKLDGYIPTTGKYSDRKSVSHSITVPEAIQDVVVNVYFEEIPTEIPKYEIVVISNSDFGYTVCNGVEIRNSRDTFYVEEGGDITVVAYPNEGYRVDRILQRRVGYIGYVSQYTDRYPAAHDSELDNINQNATITVDFEQIPEEDRIYVVAVNTEGRGYVTVNNSHQFNGSAINIKEGEVYNIVATPNVNYVVSSVSINGVEVDEHNVPSYSCVHVGSDGDFIINVKFKSVSELANISINGGGNVNIVSANETNLTLSVVPDSGYVFDRVLVDDIVVDVVENEDGTISLSEINQNSNVLFVFKNEDEGTDVDVIEMVEPIVYVANGHVEVKGTEIYKIYTVSGLDVTDRILTPGVYVVKTNYNVQKIIVE